jgi:hypothetical protein
VENWRYESLQRDVDRAHRRAGRLEDHVYAIEEWHRLLPLRVAIGMGAAVGAAFAGALIVSALHR